MLMGMEAVDIRRENKIKEGRGGEEKKRRFFTCYAQ
jgi:hypothetical protein